MCVNSYPFVLYTMCINTVDISMKRKNPFPDGKPVHACPECDYTTDRPYSLKIHSYTHMPKNLSCEVPECDYITNNPLHLKHHTLNHLDILPFACEEDGCDFQTTTKSGLTKHHKHVHEEHAIPDEAKIHACPECDYRSAFSYSLRMHLHTHASKTLSCETPDCDYITNSPLSLKTHMLRHLDVLPFPCEEENCDFATTTRGQLETHHKCVHEESKDFPCDHPGCNFSAKLEGNLRQHMATHVTEPLFNCGIGECEFSTTSLRYLKRHQEGHTGRELKFPCTYPGCEYKSAYKTHLNTHMRMHTKDYKHQCLSCEYKTISSSHLARHMLVHDESRIHSCEFPSCDYETTNIDRFNRHKETHTPEGQIRHKKQEKRVTKMLTLWGYQYDPEVTINAARGNCLIDTNRHFSRLDYHIINCVNAVLLLEVDEEQHYWYELSCEFSRMADVRASLLKAGITKPIYWIRYNPNGKYHVDFDEIKISREKRELALKAKLESLCSPDFVPESEVSIHYMFYSLMSAEMGPEIMYDEAFPEVMREVVSWK